MTRALCGKHIRQTTIRTRLDLLGATRSPGRATSSARGALPTPRPPTRSPAH